MRDAVELVNLIKQVAVNAINADKPAEIVFGKVKSVSPLKISVDQKMTLGEKQLILAQRVTEHKVFVTVDWRTEDETAPHSHTVSGSTVSAGDPSHSHLVDVTSSAEDIQHSHNIVGKVEITIHSGLAVGDEVILIRQQGGQKYIVTDRIG